MSHERPPLVGVLPKRLQRIYDEDSGVARLQSSYPDEAVVFPEKVAEAAVRAFRLKSIACRSLDFSYVTRDNRIGEIPGGTAWLVREPDESWGLFLKRCQESSLRVISYQIADSSWTGMADRRYIVLWLLEKG